MNKVVLTGNTGNDPEVRFMPDGRPVANFSVATNEFWTGKDGSRQQRTEWHRVVAFGKLADVVGKYLSKGRLVTLEGSLRTRKWKDSNQQDRSVTEVIASKVEFLGSNPNQRRPEGGNTPPEASNGSPDTTGTNSGDEPPPYQEADVDAPF